MQVDIETVRASAARAALNPAHWADTLWQVSRLVGGDMTLFEHVHKRTGLVEIGFNDRPDFIVANRDAYEAHFHRVNPRYALFNGRPVDAVIHDHMLGDEQALDREEFYMDFLRPWGLRYFMAATAADDAEQKVVFSLQRNADRGPVDEVALRAFGAVLPDIRNAMAIHLRTLHAPSGAMLSAAFDRLADPLAVMCEDGRLIFANQSMTGLLQAGDVVMLRDRALAGARETSARALATAMRQAVEGTGAGVAATPASDALGALIFRIAPLAPEEGRVFARDGDRLLCLLIDDPARPCWRAVGEAMALFGLTRREATVGAELAAGRSIDAIAARLNVSRNTVRAHLAVIRDKLGVHSSLAVAAALRRAMSPFSDYAGDGSGWA